VFAKTHLSLGQTLVKEKRIKNLLFSEGTYQVEVADPKSKKSFFPFLQLADNGKLVDCFCTCSEAEKKKSCVHLAAAYLKIFNGKLEPLHMRFRSSLWNHLAFLAHRRFGSDVDKLVKKEAGFELHFPSKKLFAIKGLTDKGKKKIESLLFQRPIETEETSLKFSNLAPEELQLWREGRASEHLQYELSFWADLAKWWMLLQEEGEKYQISFEKMGELPHWIQLRFSSVQAGFYIARIDWPEIILSLATVKSPLVVHVREHRIDKISYDPDKHCFYVKRKGKEEPPKEKGLRVGDWTFVVDKGFFPAEMDPIFDQPVIEKEKVEAVLQKHLALMEEYLEGTVVHPYAVPIRYTLVFDEDDSLHIVGFVFKEGDLTHARSAYFGSWVYLDDKGFFLLENQLFNAAQKIIPAEEMNDFINQHRAWLSNFEGFQTHIYAIESALRYTVTKEGFLLFESGLNLKDIEGIDFGEWIYVQTQGFFIKRTASSSSFYKERVPIPPTGIASFIKEHQEELEQVKGFFSEMSPLEKSGVDISLNEEGRIIIAPRFVFSNGYKGKQVQILGDYTYVEGEGFCPIPLEKRLPETFLKKRMIALQDEAYFVFYELDMLKAFILSIPKQLCKPSRFALQITELKKKKKGIKVEWILDAYFETDIGALPLFDVWKALSLNQRYHFSAGGLIVLRQMRFNWLKNVGKKQWLKNGKLKISTMDWLRLCMLEEVTLPEKESKTKEYIEMLENFTSEEEIDLTGFKSTLRSYQEVGVRWLFFLSSYGLSGLLCDEMGLGKTHQAMGLLAAARNRGAARLKFLVVCPTSVIYHWEELLKRFLPDMRVVVFYGLGRTLESFQEHADLLLTSYGTLRSERNALSALSFSIAIFDEVQIAKNPHSQTHKVLKRIDADVRIALTGTPIENRLIELKALFDIILPGYLPSDAQFKEFFVGPIEKNQDPERKKLLTRLTKPFILRRKKAEVLLELPEKIEEISYCDLSDEQKELYYAAIAQHKEAFLKEIESGTIPLAHIFSLFSTLKQICDHPCLITKELSEYQKHASGKWDLFVQLLQETRDSGQKLVIFSQYLGMLDIFASYLKEHKIGFATIRGSTRDRKEQLERFRTDPTCEVFLASLQAAGVGIDLVSASVVIHYDRWWNPARENQATDRVHRIGQNRGVQVFKMVTKNTIEEHIHRLIEKKAALLEDIISFDDQDQIKGLSKEEIIQLLKLLNLADSS
jgi:superfamily II DNA or RNA helicase